jgi:hypothetical protein
MRLPATFALVLLTACGDDGGGTINPQELITAVTLTFTPGALGTTVVAEFDDPDGDGGEPPTIDPIELVDGGIYTLTITFENRLEDPPEDITAEVEDEAEEHQIFLTGSAVGGPATDKPGAPLFHQYADQDANGLPIGLTNTIDAQVGAGELTVTLRHLPPINGNPTKTADIAGQVRDGGFSSIGGETDAQVTFDVNVP